MSPTHRKVSVVCPMYNEAAAIEDNIARLKACIATLPYATEVLLINDGSTDDTVARAARAVAGDPRFRLLSHRVNFGRGRALRTGFREARGDIIVTTEADLSWGTDIIRRMVEALDNDPGLDAVFASTHLPGGGYRNVPRHRLWLSKLGNRILRLLYSGNLSMTTGMTRAYRARVIQAHNFSYDGKEIHLEVAHRLLSFGRRVAEVPATLSWPEKTPAGAGRGQRTNWGKILRLICTHLAFGLFNGISNVIGPIILLMTALIGVFGGWAVWNMLHGLPSIYLANLTAVLVILWVNLCLGYFLIYHTSHIETNVWRTQSMLRHLFNIHKLPPDPDDYYDEIDLRQPVATPQGPAQPAA
ncbi:MAG TPA: glycosyltransferase family 2 protein [Gemmataceae bacterium]|nr:glycosyltransferase family 2 protein [Gemmataceae bacterium]